MIYNFTIYPIECVYKALYLALSEALDSYRSCSYFFVRHYLYFNASVNELGRKVSS